MAQARWKQVHYKVHLKRIFFPVVLQGVIIQWIHTFACTMQEFQNNFTTYTYTIKDDSLILLPKNLSCKKHTFSSTFLVALELHITLCTSIPLGVCCREKIFLHNHIETKQSTDESEKRLKGIQYFRFRIVMLLVKNMLYPFLKPSYNIIERKNERLFQLANV